MRALERWLVRSMLFDPKRIEQGLERVRQARPEVSLPNQWQLTLGILRMHHRVLFRFDTIGTCSDHPVRRSLRARCMKPRPVRFFFLLGMRAISPWDYSGLLSSRSRLINHLLGAHHDGVQFAYDLHVLQAHPGGLDEVHEACRRICEGRDPLSEWWRDLVVYEGYHEALLEAVEKALRGEALLTREQAADPDLSFWGYLQWCARQPATPQETWATWRRGSFSLEHDRC